MSVKFSNNATTELASSIGTSDTSITVVDGSKFPILTAGDYTYVTLDTDTASPTREIVRVTAISGNVLTVTRGQDGTSPASFAAGTKVELRLTAALLNDVAGANPSGEPIGFPDKSQTTITFDSGIRTFSITPTGASFDVYCKGIKYTYTTVQLVTIPNTTGLHFIYFNASGVLSTQMSYFTWAEHAPTAYIYWNATTQQAVYFGDERHGITLDWQTHEYLHRTRGAAIANGFLASGYTLNSSATDAATQIAIESGTFFDEDMKIDIVSTATPTAGTHQQNLLFPAKIPVLHLQGTSWVMDAPTDFPFKQGTARPQYNSLSGGVWSTTDVGNNQHATTWILATNNLTYPVIAIIGQSATDNQGEAEAFSFADLTLPGFPSVEFRPLYKLIYKASNGYANSVNAQLVSIVDLRSVSAVGAAANPATDHGNLSGLSDDDHPQYVHTSEVRTPSATVKNSFFPSQVGQTGKYLSTDGTNTVWEPAPSGSLSFTGDVTGTGSTGSSVAMTLAASGVVAGQYTKVTVDSKGRVTAGTGVTSADVTSALGYTPYNATNPAGYTTNVGTVTSVSGTGTVSGLTLTGSVTSSGSLTLGGTLSLTSGQVTTALGYTPYNATNPSGYTNNTGTVTSVSGTGTVSGLTLTGTVTGSGSLTLGGTLSLTSGQVTSALGYTPPQPGGTGASGTWGIRITGFANQGTARLYSTDAAYNYDSGAPYYGYLTYDGSRWLFQVSPGTPAAVRVAYADTAGSATDSTKLPLSGGTVTGFFGATAGSKITVQGGTDGGTGNGIMLWTNTDSNWGIYMAQSGSGRSLSGGDAPASIDGRTAHAVRFRAYGSDAIRAFIWENDLNQCVASLSPDNGNFYTRGQMYAGNSTTNLVLHTGNYSSYALPLNGGGTISGAIRASNITAGGSTNTDANLGVQGTTHLTGTIYYGGTVGNINSWSSLSTSSSGTHTFSGSRFVFDRYGYGSQPLIDMQSGSITLGQPTYAGSGITVNNASADGRGINLYSGSPTSPTYGLFFAQTGTFGTYGAVSADWATYFTMNSTAHRGWIFREHESLGNVAAISNQGNMTLRSHFEQGNNIARPNVSWSASSTSTGMVIFYLPGTTANYGMVHMVFDIYEYNGNAVSTVIVGGHNWSTSWYNTGCSVIGQCGKSVRLGCKDGRFCVVFGTSGSSWEYGTIVLRKIHNGGFYDNNMNMTGDWSSTQTTTESFTNITGDLRNLKTPSSLEVGTIGYAYQSFRSPIFYDYDNTGYYVDPASTSNLNVLAVQRAYAGYDAGVTNSFSCSEWFRSSGNTGWFNATYAGGIYMVDSTWVRVYGSKQFYADNFIQSDASVRAPTFYDSNNTGYYVDPASNSNLNTGTFNGRMKYSDYLVSNNNGGLMGDYSASGTTSKVIWTIGESWPLANMYGIGYEYGSGFDHHLAIRNNGTTYSRFGFAGGAFIGGTGTAGSDFRAPIFYDSNDTGWYLDPHSTSNLNRISTVRTNNWLYIDQNYGHSVVGVYTSVRYQGVWAMGDSYKLPADGTTTGNLYGLAWSHPNAGGIAGNLASHGLLLLENGAFKGAWGGGSFRTPGDLRGTIFYDYDNTGYYLDPTSTTSLRTVGDWRADSASWTGEFSGKIQYHSSIWYFQAATGWQFRNSGGSQMMFCDSSGNVTFNGNVTAYSDRRLKENVRDLTGAQAYLDKIAAKRFTWKDDGCEDIGFIAQDVEAAGLTEFVLETADYDPNTESASDPFKTLDYGRMVSVLWQAVKEQKSQITAMSAEINSLKERLH